LRRSLGRVDGLEAVARGARLPLNGPAAATTLSRLSTGTGGGAVVVSFGSRGSRARRVCAPAPVATTSASVVSKALAMMLGIGVRLL